MYGGYNRGITGCDGECGLCNNNGCPQHRDYIDDVNDMTDMCGYIDSGTDDIATGMCNNPQCSDRGFCILSIYSEGGLIPEDPAPSFIMHFIDGTRPNQDAV